MEFPLLYLQMSVRALKDDFRCRYRRDSAQKAQ